VTWSTEHGGTSASVTWWSTHEGTGAKAVLERDLGRSADVAEAVEIDVAEYRILRTAAQARIRP
jgi:hypothetical protein